MAKRKSLFDDKPEEIQQLTYIIKQDINALNKQIAQLQEVKKVWIQKIVKWLPYTMDLYEHERTMLEGTRVNV